MKIRPDIQRRVGHVPYKSFVHKDEKKGNFLVSTKVNGTEYTGVGTTERYATLDLKKQISEAAASDKIVSTQYVDRG